VQDYLHNTISGFGVLNTSDILVLIRLPELKRPFLPFLTIDPSMGAGYRICQPAIQGSPFLLNYQDVTDDCFSSWGGLRTGHEFFKKGPFTLSSRRRGEYTR
jgi:hypothetical protein